MSNQEKFCPKCGNIYYSDVNVCYFCKQELITNKNKSRTNYVRNTKPKLSTGKKILLTIGIIILIWICCVLSLQIFMIILNFVPTNYTG